MKILLLAHSADNLL